MALIGPSGAGKSTLLALLAGLHRPSAGRLQVGEHELGRLSPSALTRFRAAGVGTLLQGAARNLLPYATAEQNVVQARLAVGRRERRQLPTPREVLAEVGAGLTNDEIGRRLLMSGATARTHVSRVMAKLGARDRAQLVVIAYESGLLTPGAVASRSHPS